MGKKKELSKSEAVFKKIRSAVGIAATIGAILYGVYYFFFTDNEEDLDDGFLEEAAEAKKA